MIKVKCDEIRNIEDKEVNERFKLSTFIRHQIKSDESLLLHFEALDKSSIQTGNQIPWYINNRKKIV